jgi:hypothetical protein
MRIRILFFVDEAEESERGGKPERESGEENRPHAHGRKRSRAAREPAPVRSPLGPPDANRDR